MKEFDYVLESILGGLYAEDQPSKKTPRLEQCHNAMPIEKDYVMHTAVDGIADPTDGWPWPRLWFTEHFILMVAIDTSSLVLYELTWDGTDITETEIATLGDLADITSVDVVSSDKFYMVFVDGTDHTILQRNPFYSTNKAMVSTVDSMNIPHGTCACMYRGQLLIGGLVSKDGKWNNLGRCGVAWSSIGEVNMQPAFDLQAGFTKMPWDFDGSGTVLAIKPLGDGVRVYGNYGIAQLTPFQNDVVIGFGRTDISQVGILSKDAIAGDDKLHCFLSPSKELHLSSAEGIKNLGYKSHMSTLGDDIIISYDGLMERFFISDGSKCYVLSKHGLYTTHQCVNSIGRLGNDVVGGVSDNGDDYIRLVTTPFDITQQGLKTVENVEVGLDYVSDEQEIPTGCIYYRYGYNESFGSLNWVYLNQRGIFTQKCTAREFKVGLRMPFTGTQSFGLGYVKVKVKFSDKRNVRGRLNVD